MLNSLAHAIFSLALITSIALLGGCEKKEEKPPDPEIPVLQKQQTDLEKQMKDTEASLQAADRDPVKKAELVEAKQLLSSRIERIKNNLKLKGAITEAPAKGH